MASETARMDAKESIVIFTEFFENNCIDKIASTNSVLEVGFDSLSKWNIDLANELLANPEDTIKAAEIALKSIDITEDKELSVWFVGLPKSQQKNIWQVRKNDIGGMLGLRGIINKISPITPICKSAKFECPTCGSITTILQTDTAFKEPSKCSCGRKGRMIMLHKEMEDTIKLGLIDDLMEEDNADRSIAREKLSILSGDNLTSQDIDRRLKPGKKVIINGYFKYMQKANSKEFDLVFQANSIEFVEVGWDTVKVNKTEERQIKELAKQDDIIERLSDSIADVEGFKEVKAACLLLLAGAPHMHDKNKHLVSRGTIHVLLIGNPGTGKSFLAKRAGAISPLHYFQSAATASGKGLVASVVKDPDIDGYAVYPGVVVMASKGVATIDEIDKTNKDDYGDHNNAMNECEVTIAKANIKARLEADTSYLATANPEHRVFTTFEPYHEQIAMPKDFQDRFDIIFPMMPSDKAEERDRIMDIMLERHIGDEEQKKWNPEFTHEFIRKYIAYCRRANPKPKVSRELFKTIKKRLSELMRPKDEEQVKVSYRHLESIMRFAYASARLRLRDITESDIDLAFSLKFASFKELGIIDISGAYNWSVEEGVQEEKISDDKVIHDILKEMLPDTSALAEIQEIVNACIKKGIEEEKVDEYIEKKKMMGDFIEPKRGFLKRM